MEHYKIYHSYFSMLKNIQSSNCQLYKKILKLLLLFSIFFYAFVIIAVKLLLLKRILILVMI